MKNWPSDGIGIHARFKTWILWVQVPPWPPWSLIPIGRGSGFKFRQVWVRIPEGPPKYNTIDIDLIIS